MSIKYGNSIDLDGFEIQNFVIQNLASAPAISKGGAMYWNTSDQNLKLYDTEGTSWFNVVQGTNLSTDKGIVIWDGIKGKRLYDSQITIDETGPLTGLTNSIPVASIIKDYVDTEISGITIPVYTASAGITKTVNDFSLDFATLSNQTTMLNDDAFVFRKDSTGVHYNIKLSDLITLVGGGGGTGYLKLDQSSQQTIIGGPLVDFIDFNTAYSNGNLEGRLHWNTDDGTLEVGMPGGNVVLQIGQENLIRVNNEELVTIPNGTVVYASSSSGNIKYVKIASYDDGIDANRVVGVATEDILSGQFGYITTFGLVRDIPLSGFIGGQNVYLGLNGAVQSTKPAAPYKSVVVGIVVRPHLTEGELYVKIKPIPTYSEVNAIGDPGTSIDREILIWDGTTGNQVRVNTGAAISSLGHMTVSGDVIAYASGSPMSSFWDDMPKATETTMGGFKFYTSQFEWTGVGNDQLKIKDSVLVPAEHEHSWQDITSGTQPAPVAHELTGSLHTASGLTAGHFLKATGLTTFAFEAHGLTYSDVGAIASPGVSVDREILIWNGITGNAVRTSTGAVITTEGHMTVSGDVIAYSSGSPSSSFWDDMPKATETTMGGFMFYPSQFEWTGPDNAQLKIKDSVLVPASHTHAWTDITSVPDNLTSIISLAYTTSSFVKMTGVNTFSLDTNTYSLTTHNHAGVYQPLSTNLTSLADLTYSSTAFVKMTALGTFTLDTNTYSLDGHTHTNMVDYTGTPLTNQIAYFLDNNTIQGNTNFTFNGTLLYLGAGQLSSGVVDGVSAIGFKLSTPSYSTAGAKLVSILNDTTEKLSLDKDGTVQVTGDVIAYSSGAPSSFTTDSFKTWTVQSDSGYTWGSSDLVAAGMDIVDFVAGSGITIATDSTLKAIKIAVTTGSGMVYPSAGIAVSTGTAWGSSITDNSTNWNTAYSWGDHSTEGYLTSFTETDPIFAASAAYGITSTNISNWNTAYSWGDHTTMGYLDYNDPAADITSQQITNWDAAFSVAHNAVTIGTTANGLALSGQELSLNLSSISSAGAMSAADKIKLNDTLSSTEIAAAYEPIISPKGTAFNANYGTTSGTVAVGNHTHSQLHDPVSIGTANGLSLTGQQLSLADATTSVSGAMSSSDKIKLDSIQSNAINQTTADGRYSQLGHSHTSILTIKGGSVDAGEALDLGDTLVFEGSGAVEVSRTDNVITIDATVPSGGITTLNEGSGIMVTGTGSSRTIETRIDEDTIIYDPLDEITMKVDTSKIALKTDLHSPVSLGVNTNGLSLSGQVLELDLATTTSAGAMSTADKIKLNSALVSGANLFTLKNTDVDVGEPIPQGGNLVIKGGNTVTVDRTDNELTIDATFNGLTSINEGAGIAVSGTGNSRTIAARIGSNMTWVADGSNNAIDIDTSKVALKTDLHNAVTIGTKPNGLSLNGQAISLSLATTSNAGAMSAGDKTILNNLSSNLFTLKSNGVEDGIDITAGDTVTIQGSDNVEVSRSGSTLTISANASSGGITTLSGGIGINVTGSGSSRTISAKIDNDTIIIDELNNQMMVDSSKLAVASANSNGAMSAAHYNIVNNLPSTFVGGSGTSGWIPRFTPNGSTLGNSSIRDNGSSMAVGTTVSTLYKIYAYASNTNASIRGYNSSSLSGSAGVNGEANGSGQGYLSRYDGTRRAAIYGIVGTGSGTKYAGYFSGDVLATGDVYSNSDIRLKKNIKPIENPLQRLMEVKPVAFNWKVDEGNKVNYGVIAQELQEVFPELVANDGVYLTVRYQELIGVAVAALQEQQKQIEIQNKRINSLEKRLKKLENGTSNK